MDDANTLGLSGGALQATNAVLEICEIVTEQRLGDSLNLEGDILGKYVARMLGERGRSVITEEMLAENGFI